MTVWNKAKGYEDALKVSTKCEVMSTEGKVFATKAVDGDVTFTYKKKKLSAYKLAVDTFGERYVCIPE